MDDQEKRRANHDPKKRGRSSPFEYNMAQIHVGNYVKRKDIAPKREDGTVSDKDIFIVKEVDGGGPK
jgi:hypothetical protein